MELKYFNISCGKKSKIWKFMLFWLKQLVLPTVKILTFSSGESIKDELRHSHRRKVFCQIQDGVWCADVRDAGRDTNEHNFGIFQYFCVLFVAVGLWCFCQQAHMLN
jgi:hypothetical protein